MNVLDASAVIALIRKEPGADEIYEYLGGAIMSTVNLSEVLQKSAQKGFDPIEVARMLSQIGIETVNFDEAMAAHTSQLWASTRHRGLSLADRACLALAAAVHGLAVTTDTAWTDLDIAGIDVHVVSRR